jgi:hypothetical protein
MRILIRNRYRCRLVRPLMMVVAALLQQIVLLLQLSLIAIAVTHAAFIVVDNDGVSMRTHHRRTVAIGNRRPIRGGIQHRSAKRSVADESVTLQQQQQQHQDALQARKKSLLNALESGLRNCGSATQARRVLEKELPVLPPRRNNNNNEEGEEENKSNVLFKSVAIPPGASARGISDGDLAIQTRMSRSNKYGILDLVDLNGNRDADLASLGVVTVFASSTVAALLANQNLPGPEIVRFLVVWILTFTPLALVGYGIRDADALQTVLVQVQRSVFPAYRQRMVQHEAGHLLIGHLLGLPIQAYTANAVRNAVSFYPLSDPDKGRDYARQLGFDKGKQQNENYELWPLPSRPDVPFFSEQGRGADVVEERSVFRKDKNSADNPFLKLPAQNEPTTTWPYRGFDERTLDQLTVVSVAGVCAEILAFGNAEGGVADFGQLRQIFGAAETELSERDMENRIRFALGYTISLLRRHLGALDALAEVMERDGSIAECVVAIEGSRENTSGQDGIMGDYELRRREAFRFNGTGWIEHVLLGSDKTIDTIENRLQEGKGGGSRKQSVRLTGDDPLYLALAIAFVFLTWASAGGLSLH